MPAKLLISQGNGNFAPAIDIGGNYAKKYEGSIAFADYDGDGIGAD